MGSAPEETGAGASASANSPVSSSGGASSSGAYSSPSRPLCSSPGPCFPIGPFIPNVDLPPVPTPLARELLTLEAIKNFEVRPSKPLPHCLIEIFSRMESSGVRPPFLGSLQLAGDHFTDELIAEHNLHRYSVLTPAELMRVVASMPDSTCDLVISSDEAFEDLSSLSSNDVRKVSLYEK